MQRPNISRLNCACLAQSSRLAVSAALSEIVHSCHTIAFRIMWCVSFNLKKPQYKSASILNLRFVNVRNLNIQSTLVISKSQESSEILPDIRTSTYQICRIEEKNKLNNHISQMYIYFDSRS